MINVGLSIMMYDQLIKLSLAVILDRLDYY